MKFKEEDQIDRLKSSFGLGNKGRLQKRKKKSEKKRSQKEQEEIEYLRREWYKRFGQKYE